MPSFRALRRGLRALLHSRESANDIAEEVQSYVDEATAAHIARGVPPGEARRAARAEIGSLTSVCQQVHESGWEHAIETVLQDAQYACRRLRKDPLFTLTATVTLALGIGASTAVFSTIRPTLLEPLPFPNAERLVTIDDWNATGIAAPSTFGTYEEVRSRSHAFDRLAAVDRWRPSLIGSGDPERLDGQRVTADYFRVFGVPPIVGRDFTPVDDTPGAPNVVVLSDTLAQRRFGGAEPALHQTVDLDGNPYLVVGIMPHGFIDVLARSTEIWSPLRERAVSGFNGREWGHHYQIIGRLAGSSNVAEATSTLQQIGRSPIPVFPRPAWANLSRGLLVRPLQDVVIGSAKPALFTVTASVFLLLVAASVNAAGLLLAAGVRRRAEFALRLALGASRRRVVAQILTESVALSLLGGGLGLGVALAAVRALVALSPPGLPRVEAIGLDGHVFLFAIGLAALLGVLVGLVPACCAFHPAAVDGVRRGASRASVDRTFARRAFVVSEMALALTLLVGAGLLLRSVTKLLSVPPGFDPSHVVTMQVVEAGHGFDNNRARLQFYDRALEAVQRVPGVASAAFTSQLPLSGETDGYGYVVEGGAPTPPGAGDEGSALRYTVTADYFNAMGIPLIRGRFLRSDDRPDAPEAVVINERFARRLFGKDDPLGRRIRFGPEMAAQRPWDEIVGVVADVRHYSLAADAPNAFYVANGQWPNVDNVETLVVRTSGEPGSLAPSIVRAIRATNSNVPIAKVALMTAYVEASAGSRRFTLLAIEIFAAAALVLAAIGLYGFVSGSVNERTREIGVRAALGASPAAIVRDVVGGSLWLTLGGIAIGLCVSVLASRLIASLLFDVSPLDPLTYGAVAAVVAGVALLAAWAPARRASRIDPAIALRAE